ncbi:hypothetical protein CRM22_008706 [Opisthorchis felineus]|uniref:Uncharacterized protein n=1 Tax=Opisthorchis felineus TaxID=147828 RepID=A0A4S2LI07_OPIFE|nr:hypothetical protein CRM22_008706 [Opisthorchis felineus]
MIHHADATAKVARKPVKYTSDELKLLVKLTTQARDLLQQENKINLFMEKAVWTQIANHMHATGFPKRSWVVLRTKGVRMLADSLAERRFTVSATNSLADYSQVSDGVGTLCSSSSRPPYHMGANDLECLMQRGTQPPPLIHSSEASATTLMALAHSDCFPHASVSSTSPSAIPQILNVRSTAIAPSASTPSLLVQTGGDYFVSTPAHVAPVNQFRSPVSDYPRRIHLSVSSDEDDKVTTATTTSRGTTVSSLSTLPCVGSGCSDELEKCTQSSQLQVQICRKQLEILEMKKIYWMEKLKRLQSQLPHG